MYYFVIQINFIYLLCVKVHISDTDDIHKEKSI